MQKPTMILFDYGETLVHELYYDPQRGHEALLRCASRIPPGVDAEALRQLYHQVENTLGRTSQQAWNAMVTEVHYHTYQRFAYEYLGIEFDKTPVELEMVMWDAAAPGEAMPGIESLLDFLHDNGIRTGVISNLSFSGQALQNRLNRLLPRHHFEFVMTSSDYVFRKPQPLLFQLALKKAGLAAGAVWFCGDNPVCDIQGALGVGMYPVLYREKDLEKGKINGEYLHIYDWEQLENMLIALK